MDFVAEMVIIGLLAQRRISRPKLLQEIPMDQLHENINENKVFGAVSNLIKGKKAFTIGVTSNLERLRLSPEINGNYIEIRTMWASTSQARIVQKWAEVLAHVSKKKEGKNLNSTFLQMSIQQHG